METDQLLFYSITAVVLTMASGLIPLMGRWKNDHLHSFVSFSAGVLLSTAFLHILPDALEKTDPHKAGVSILLSFVFLFILEKFIMVHPCEESHCDYHTMGKAAFVGMLVHTFFDGFALGAALIIDGLGDMVFLAIMAHKIPSSFSLSSILKKGGWKNSKIAVYILIFGLVIPAGALTSHTILRDVESGVVGIALALSLGTFIYISTSDFLPEVHRAHSHRIKNLVSFLAGIALMTALAFLLPHHM